MWWLYILYSKCINRYHIGNTQDMERRLRQHNSPSSKGWTARGRPWEAVFGQEFPDRLSALKAERTMKRKRSRR